VAISGKRSCGHKEHLLPLNKLSNSAIDGSWKLPHALMPPIQKAAISAAFGFN
jgi:hypothetical protein